MSEVKRNEWSEAKRMKCNVTNETHEALSGGVSGMNEVDELLEFEE